MMASIRPYSPDLDRDGIKRELNIPADSNVIGIVGNVRSWKGQKYFIEAFILLSQKYQNLYGLIIGGWSDLDLDYLGALQKTIRESRLEKRILFLGYRNDTPALLSVLDVFIHASIQPEPFGMVLLEAMASKVPVIATKFGGPSRSLKREMRGTCSTERCECNRRGMYKIFLR